MKHIAGDMADIAIALFVCSDVLFTAQATFTLAFPFADKKTLYCSIAVTLAILVFFFS
jgi:hypothetical protein